MAIRLVIALAVKHGWQLVTSRQAYLNAHLPEPVYLRPPKGLEAMEAQTVSEHRDDWQLFAEKNRAFGMKSVTDDDMVLMHRTATGKTLVIAIVVDDCLMATDDDELRLAWV